MMTSRSASERAAFALKELAADACVVDVGCGPGTVSLGLARAVAPTGSVLGIDAEPSQIDSAQMLAQEAGLTNLRFKVGSAYSLPVGDSGADMYFSHAMFEHLSAPDEALGEARRVLRAHGVLAVSASDWSRARFDPWTADVALAMEGHYLLRRRAGGDPFAGGQLVEWVRDAGFRDITESIRLRVDLSYRQLAFYVLKRLDTALRESPDDDRIVAAHAAATRWAATDGSVHQCWTEVTARRA
jgi:ubiquinone/menaquinone biosynthesis C-methylase UbiE